MKFTLLYFKLSVAAHVLAWVAFLFIALWPSFYSGTSTTPVGPDGSGGEVASHTASIVSVNGWWVLVPLLVPVAISALGLAVTWTWDGRSIRNKLLIWPLAVLLIAFCTLAMFSVGIFYLPGGLALLAAAIAMSLKGSPAPRPGISE